MHAAELGTLVGQLTESNPRLRMRDLSFTAKPAAPPANWFRSLLPNGLDDGQHFHPSRGKCSDIDGNVLPALTHCNDPVELAPAGGPRGIRGDRLGMPGRAGTSRDRGERHHEGPRGESLSLGEDPPPFSHPAMGHPLPGSLAGSPPTFTYREATSPG